LRQHDGSRMLIAWPRKPLPLPSDQTGGGSGTADTDDDEDESAHTATDRDERGSSSEQQSEVEEAINSHISGGSNGSNAMGTREGFYYPRTLEDGDSTYVLDPRNDGRYQIEVRPDSLQAISGYLSGRPESRDEEMGST
jgi:hypothetical protein